MPDTTAAILEAAAVAAAAQPTAERAAIIANYVCRADQDAQPAVLAAWHKAEDWTGGDGAFVWYLGRRSSPASIAAGLRRAATAGQPPEREDQFTHLSHAELLAEARRWHHNALRWRQAHDALKPSADAMIADAEQRLDRAKGLLSARRKTVSMDALREALLGDLPAQPP